MSKSNIISVLETAYVWKDAREKLNEYQKMNGRDPWQEIIGNKNHPSWQTVDSLLHQEVNCAQLLINCLSQSEGMIEKSLAQLQNMKHTENSESHPVASAYKEIVKSDSIKLNEIRLQKNNQVEEEIVVKNPRLSLRGVSPAEFLQLLYNFAAYKLHSEDAPQMSDLDANDIVEDSETGWIHIVNGIQIDVHVWGLKEVKEEEARNYNERYGHGEGRNGEALELVQSMLAGIRKYGD